MEFNHRSHPVDAVTTELLEFDPYTYDTPSTQLVETPLIWSLSDKKGSSGPEIRRRIKKATETFKRLWRVWAMKGLPLKLKDRLYSAFVHSVLSYNCEVWNITETEMKALVGRNGYLMRRLVGEVVKKCGWQEIDGEPAAREA